MKPSYLFFCCFLGTFNFANCQAITSPKTLCISEIFPDPTPSVGLPEKEFIELYNASHDTIALGGMTLADLDKVFTFPSKSLAPKSYLILCKSSDIPLFKTFGDVLGFTSFITLNNDGDEISIKNKSGTLLDQISYLHNGFAEGYTLENQSYNSFCNTASTWSISKANLGGTPGKANFNKTLSENPPLIIDKVVNLSDSTLEVFLNFSINEFYLEQAKFNIDSGNFLGKTQDYNSVENKLILQLERSLLPGMTYTLEVSGLRSCLTDSVTDLEKVFNSKSSNHNFGLVVNEILFDPSPDQVDFIELYNSSSEIIDLKDFYFGSIANGSIKVSKAINDEPLNLAPGNYLAFTSNKNMLCQHYKTCQLSNIHEIELPAYNNTEGTVLLLNSMHKVIDSVPYKSNYHFALLSEKEGVSLERISYKDPSTSKDNWHSAASTVGFATPGLENSQISQFQNLEGWNVEPLSFSPNGDGQKDFAEIHYSLPNSKVASLNIHDSQGRIVKNILNNTTIPTKGFLQWDGTRDDLSLANPGYYIVHIKTFDLSGETTELKKTVVLGFSPN